MGVGPAGVCPAAPPSPSPPPNRDPSHPVTLAAGGAVPPPLPRRLEGDARHALDLGRGVAQGVYGRASFASARLAVVEPARELPHNQHVDILEPVRLER